MRTAQHASDSRAIFLAEALWRIRDIREGLGCFLDTIIPLLAADSGVVQLRRDGAAFELVADRGIDDSLRPLIVAQPAPCPVWGADLAAGRRVVMNELSGGGGAALMLTAGWQSWQATPLIDSQQQLIGVLWTHFRRPWVGDPDMLEELDACCRIAAAFVERGRAEFRMDAETLLRSAVEDMSDAVLVFIPATRTHLFNDALVHVHGFADRAECMRAVDDPDFFELLDSRGEPLERSRWPIVRACAGESGSGEYYRMCRKDTGTVHSFISRFAPIRDGSGAIVAGSITMRDITVQEQAELADRRRGHLLEELVAARTHELENAQHQAEQAAVSRMRLLAAASHDLRQPLQAMALWVTVLMGSVDADERRQAGERLSTSVASMATLLDSLLEHSRIARGALVPQVRDVAVSTVLMPLAANWQREASTKGLSFEVYCGDPASLSTDPVMLTRILGNLVSNAIRYTERGSVALACEPLGEGFLRMSVADTGRGIPAHDLEEIFTEHVRVERSGDAGGRSFGLGLAIVRGLADSLGCRVGVRSEPGKGSCFWVDVPRSLA